MVPVNVVNDKEKESSSLQSELPENIEGGASPSKLQCLAIKEGLTFGNQRKVQKSAQPLQEQAAKVGKGEPLEKTDLLRKTIESKKRKLVPVGSKGQESRSPKLGISQTSGRVPTSEQPPLAPQCSLPTLTRSQSMLKWRM